MEFYRHFSPHSARVDWCERNYEITPYVAEFYNTISNVIFIVLPPSLWLLFRPYSFHVSRGVSLVLGMFVLIGFASAYFHATLSLVGQLMDELVILWAMLLSLGLWTPRWAIQCAPFIDNRRGLQRCMLVVALASTMLGFMRPEVNAFVLVTFSVPFVVMLLWQVSMTTDARCFRLGLSAICFWGLAIGCWLSDRFHCSVWIRFSFPYLHGIWHILVFIAAYQCLVVGAYVHAEEEFKSLQPRINYLNMRLFPVRIPYVELCNVKDRTV